MMLRIKRKIRKFSIWLNKVTREWVIEPSLWYSLDISKTEEQLDEVEKKLIEREKLFPGDPAFSRAYSILWRKRLVERTRKPKQDIGGSE